LVDQALAAEPGYYYFAVAEANYLLPKWYGKPGDTEQFAARAADQVGGADGDEATAQRFFARIGNDWNESVWKTKALYEATRSGKALSTTPPLMSDADGLNEASN
jgi:hypothetical protein